MTIIRDGKEIKLTPEELRQAYYEKKQEYDIEDIRSRYNVPDDKIEDVVERFNDYLGCNDNFWESYWMTLEYLCDEMGFSEVED